MNAPRDEAEDAALDEDLEGDLGEDEEAEAPPGRFRAWFERNRRRLAKIALVVFLVAVAVEIGSALPRDVEVGLRFPDHGAVVEARIEYLEEDETVREVTLRWSDGAPALVRDTVELSPGEYDVAVVLLDAAGRARELRGRLHAPADGVVQVRLHE
ncbi:MAG: hypothetical protein KF729_03360 [Sandaracinaceae bacterium]|nr:hypothetical protein [Sandaracinaceae bacterium]